jgi:ATP-binding cassette subfamily B protein
MRFSALIDGFSPADGPPPKTLYRFIRWALRGALPVIFTSLVISVTVGLLEVSAAFILGWIIDFTIAHGAENLFANNWLLFAALIFFFVAVRPGFMGLSSGFQSLGIAPNIFPMILSRLHRHTLGQALSFFDDDFAGRIAQKQQQTARALTDIVMETMNVGGFAVASVLGALALVGTIHPILAVFLLIWVTAYFSHIYWFLPRIRKRSKARAAARAMVTGQVVDTITNIPTVKLFAHAKHEDSAALDALSRFRETAVHWGQLSVWFRYTLMTLAGTLPVLMIGGALWLWTNGQASVGDIAAAGLIATRLSQMSGWVAFTALGIFSNIGEVEDGMHTLAVDHAIVDTKNAHTPQRATGAIAFHDVTFGYGRKGIGLENFNLTLAPGAKIGLVGRSGAGKTTAVSLLLRLYDIEAGRITLDGVDISELTQDGLRQQISMVTQDTAMFNRSAMENIRYGNPEASDTQVMEAARLAEAHEFIKALEDFKGRTGYDAHLGERGVKLSGGQRQRIALARAILKDAPVLVLDEATSALDSEVEAEIQKTLYSLMEGKTVIAIAHRLSTIARMDRILVLNEGRVIEEGSHDVLLAQNGLYSEFWTRQSGGFLGLEAAE